MTEPMLPQHVQAYKDATDNLMFLKREQVQITFYTWMLLAALYILAMSPNENEKAFLATGAFIVGILSVGILASIYGSMGRLRARLQHIYDTYFDETDREKMHLDAKSSHPFVTCVLVLACIAAAGFTIKLIL